MSLPRDMSDPEHREEYDFRFAEPGHDGGREHVMVCGSETAKAIREELNAAAHRESGGADGCQNSDERKNHG